METIQEYIKSCPIVMQPRLQEIYTCMKETDTKLIEKISWGMPTFYYHRNVIHFALHKNHIGIYPGEETMVHFEQELKKYKRSKGAFQILHTQDIPESLIRDIIKYHLQLID